MAKKLLFQLDPYSDTTYSKVTLPVSPSSFEVEYPQNSTSLNINAKGDINLLGYRGLRTVSLESFYPAQQYGFCVAPVTMEPYRFVKVISYWKNHNVKLYFKAGEDVNFLCTVTDFRFGEDDGSGDVKFAIELTEYRKIGTSRVKKHQKGKTYTVKKGDTVSKIAKKKLGKSSYGKKIYSINKKKIESAWKRHRKNEAIKEAKAWNKKHPDKEHTWRYYYKQQKRKNSHNGKYLIKGTKLVLPKVKKK